MTDEVPPLYEVHILSMPVEKFAEIAIDGAIWLAGEYLSHGRQINETFIPDPSHIYMPRHCEVTIIALDRANQRLRHQIFVEGFRKLPESGAHRMFESLLMTHREMLEEAFRTEWQRRRGQKFEESRSVVTKSVTKSVANELLSSPSDPR